MTKNNLKNFISIIFLTVIFAIGTSIPLGIISAISSVILVGLIGYAVTRFHYTLVGLVCICTFVPYAIFGADIISALYAYSEVILCALALGICFNLKLSGIKTISIVSGFHIVYTLLTMMITGVGKDFVTSLNDTMQSLYPLYEGHISQEDFRSVMMITVDMITRFVPSIVVLSGFFAGIIYFGAFRLILKITKSESFYERFSDCRADKSLSVMYFVITFINFLLPAENYYSDIVANVVLITTFVFFVFGLALIAHKLNTRFGNSPKKKLLFTLAVISPLFLLGLPFTVIGYIGALDGIFDFRHKNTQKNTISKD